MKTSAKKLTYGALIVAAAVILPQAFHLSGVPNSGAVFLPMHIPVLLGGLILGPWFGLVVGIFAPIVSSLITAMPPLARLPYMVFELAGYGFFAGLCYHTFGWHRKKGGIYLSLIAAMLFGRVVYTLAVLGAFLLFHVQAGGWLVAVKATVTGISGIVIQLMFIPPLTYALRKAGLLDEFLGTGAKDSR